MAHKVKYIIITDNTKILPEQCQEDLNRGIAMLKFMPKEAFKYKIKLTQIHNRC